MSHPKKGCMQSICTIEHIASTSPNKRIIGGGRVILTLACGHKVNTRASAMTRHKGRLTMPKKAQCYECVKIRQAAAYYEESLSRP